MLLLRVSLHRFHEIRNQVRAPLQLHLDLRLSGVHLLVVRLDRVVATPPEQREQNGRKAKGPASVSVHEGFLCRRFTYSAVGGIAARYARGAVSASGGDPRSAAAA